MRTSQKEGQEDQDTLKAIGGFPLALLLLPGPPGLPSGAPLVDFQEGLGEPGRARKSQEEPGVTRRSQENPGGAKRSQDEPRGARGSQKEPG